MKTNLLTVLIFAFASVLYSCSKESNEIYSADNSQENSTALTTAQRRIIISNCSGHAGCHSSARLIDAGSMYEVTHLLRGSIDPGHNFSVCEKNKLQLWFNNEINY